MTSVDELLGLGRKLFQHGRFAEVERAFDGAARLAPESVEALFQLAATLVAFEPRARLSPALVTAGLISARIAPGTEYEDKCLPLALGWPYGKGEARYVGVTLALAEYFDVSRAALYRLHRTYNALRQGERANAPDLAVLRPRGSGLIRLGYLSADFRDHVMARAARSACSRSTSSFPTRMSTWRTPPRTRSRRLCSSKAACCRCAGSRPAPTRHHAKRSASIRTPWSSACS